MCGIVGVVAKKNKENISMKEILKMNELQKHRGPDDRGVVVIDTSLCKGYAPDNREEVVGKSIVAFNRLSIQDLSLNGHQPMMNVNENVIIAFNGEVYNFRELRNDLEKRKYVFNSKSDTELILNLYLEYGIEKMLQKLNGMFAIVLYDLRIKKLYLVRDRFGIKPLYFTLTNNYLLYASEMKCFMEFHEFNPSLDDSVLGEYTLFRNVFSGSLFKNVEQIMPGQVIEICLEKMVISKWKYFDINLYHRKERINKSLSVIKEELEEVISDSIYRQMISDVKVGCQLSGGIDSSLVTYIAAKKYGLSDTISVVVNDDRFSEEKYIDCANSKVNVNNSKLLLDEKYYVNNYVNTIWHFEGITVHPSTLGVYQIAEAAKKNVTVLLSGEGADEVFGGYKCFTDQFRYDLKNEEIYMNYVISANGKVADDIAGKMYPLIDIEDQLERRKKLFNSLEGSRFDRQVKYEMSTYLPELLIRQDKMSMAHSIENRVPMLDNEIVDYAFCIPEEFLLNRENQQGKDILKQISVPIFGEEFAYRKKMGFGLPTNTYLLSNPIFFRKIIDNLKKRDIINGKLMEAWSKDVTKLRGLDAELFFKMFGFEVWCELFLDKLSITDIMERG